MESKKERSSATFFLGSFFAPPLLLDSLDAPTMHCPFLNFTVVFHVVVESSCAYVGRGKCGDIAIMQHEEHTYRYEIVTHVLLGKCLL